MLPVGPCNHEEAEECTLYFLVLALIYSKFTSVTFSFVGQVTSLSQSSDIFSPFVIGLVTPM
jgi:hypothetical protein